MFTKKDLQNGDVIKKRNGNVEILVLPLGTLVCDDGHYNMFDDINDDLTSKVDAYYDIVAVRRPTKVHECRFLAFRNEKGELVYDRERDTTTKYNGKVVCIGLNPESLGAYTVGKIYQFNAGKLIDDYGNVRPTVSDIHNFSDWEKYTNSRFIEIKE